MNNQNLHTCFLSLSDATNDSAFGATLSTIGSDTNLQNDMEAHGKLGLSQLH